MQLYRISQKSFAGDLRGEGAKRFGGRWNSPGTPCLYASTSRSLAICEFSAHITLDNLPPQLVIITLEVDETKIDSLPGELPDDWSSTPVSKVSQYFGDQLLIKGTSLGYFVPSVIVREENNCILNPLFAEYFNLVKIEDISPLLFDRRIIS